MTTNTVLFSKRQSIGRWFRFRAAFVIVALIAIGCSWLAIELQQYERAQKKAVDAIKIAGGRVRFEPAWFSKLLGDESLATVTVVELFGESVTDDVLVHLRGFPQLRKLCLLHTKVTDAGLVNLQGLSQLEELHIPDAQVTDRGLASLQGLKQLQVPVSQTLKSAMLG